MVIPVCGLQWTILGAVDSHRRFGKSIIPQKKPAKNESQSKFKQEQMGGPGRFMGHKTQGEKIKTQAKKRKGYVAKRAESEETNKAQPQKSNGDYLLKWEEQPATIG